MEAPEGPSPPGGNAASVPGGGGPARERPRFRGTQDWREEDDPLKYLKGAAYYKELRAQKAAKEKERRRLVKALASGAPPSGATAAAGISNPGWAGPVLPAFTQIGRAHV